MLWLNGSGGGGGGECEKRRRRSGCRLKIGCERNNNNVPGISNYDDVDEGFEG